jgi:hypothetical protein
LILAEVVLEPLFQEFILQSKPAYQPLQLFYSILKGGFFCRLIVKLAPAVLFLPVVKQTGVDIVTATELGGTAFAAQKLLYYLTLKL